MPHSPNIPISLYLPVCLVGAALTQVSMATPAAGVPMVWTPVGLVAGALVIAPRRQWLTLIVVGYLAMAAPAVAHAHTLLGPAAFTAVTVAEAILAAVLLRALTGPDVDLAQLSHIAALFAVAAVAPIAGGLGIATVARMSGSPIPFGAEWAVSWITDALGILLGAPLVFGWRRFPDGVMSPPRWRAIEAIALVAALVIGSEAVFGGLLPAVLRAPALLMPLLFVAVFRFGPAGTAAALLTIVLVALPNTVFGHGPFATPNTPVFDALLRGKVIGTMATVSFLLLASALAERRRIAQERAALVEDLQQALLEIKTLQGFIPICAWCHNVRDDAGFWEGIEGYLQRHTDAVFSHGICPTCSAREHVELEEHRASAPAGIQGTAPASKPPS